MPPTENDLLRQIIEGFPGLLPSRFNDLIRNRDTRALSDEQFSELLRLNDRVELLEATRARLLAELARLKQEPADETQKEPGIPPAAPQ